MCRASGLCVPVQRVLACQPVDSGPEGVSIHPKFTAVTLSLYQALGHVADRSLSDSQSRTLWRAHSCLPRRDSSRACLGSCLNYRRASRRVTHECARHNWRLMRYRVSGSYIPRTRADQVSYALAFPRFMKSMACFATVSIFANIFGLLATVRHSGRKSRTFSQTNSNSLPLWQNSSGVSTPAVMNDATISQ